MSKKKDLLLLGLLILLLVVVNYSFIDFFLKSFFDIYEYGVVERVIDGDTVEINGTSVRLLGINTPERGEKYYEEAKEFLENEVLNKNVRLEFGQEKYDWYGRELAYIFLGSKNINLEVVSSGWGNYYFPVGKQRYYLDFVSAWEECVDENLVGTSCENSVDECVNCILLKKVDVKNQEVILENVCNKDCDISGWGVKDEGRKNYFFGGGSFIFAGDEIKLIVGEGEDSFGKYYWAGESYVWTSSGDTLFLRDSEGKLVLWEIVE